MFLFVNTVQVKTDLEYRRQFGIIKLSKKLVI